MRILYCLLFAGFTAALASTAVAGQIGQGRGPAPACRTYSAEEVRTLSGAASGNINQSCHFDAATLERVCTMQSRTSASSFTLKLTDKYESIADFVDEIRVIPPISRIRTQARRFPSGPAPNADVTYSYDTQGRQTRLTTAMAGRQQVVTYSAWDAAGRPTGALSNNVALQYKYDDTARTMTITGPAGVETDTYDADGNMIHEVSMDGGGTTTFAIKITKTEKVCRTQQ